MAEQAKVTSVDALEKFRNSLIMFLNTAHQHLDGVGDDVRRMRGWVQSEQRLYWQSELRKRNQLLELAEQELYSAKLSALRDNISNQQNAVRKARVAVTEAEEKLRAVKMWTRNFDHAADPMLKRLEGLRQLLDHDMPKGISFLVQAQKTLEAYGEIRLGEPPKVASATPPAAEGA
jgi:hypothetical protein